MSKARYEEIFRRECANSYPEITEFEKSCGFAVATDQLQDAARVLACPLKVNPPNWQHGRVIYAAVSRLLSIDRSSGVFLDIGTAKGFSAVVAGWAIADSKAAHELLSVDIVDPILKVSRNSAAEMDGELLTVAEFVRPFKDAFVPMKFFGGGSLKLLEHLRNARQRVRFAFVDGKHSHDAVLADMGHLKNLQLSGDVIVFDDIQIPPVAQAVSKLRSYDTTLLNAGSMRRYIVAVKQ